MKSLILGACLLGAFTLPAWSQLPQNQEQYWRQVDEQMRQQEQQRWAQEMNEQSRWYAEQQAQQNDYDPGPPQDSMTTMLRQSSAMAEVSRDLMVDPKLEQFKRGFWEYHAVSDQYRSAMFISPSGLISVHGPGGSYQGAMLMLWGPNIPTPAKLSVIKVSLKQNNDPAQEVSALNYGFPGVTGWGTLIFVVPSAQALISNMEDVQRFTARIGNAEVFSSQWHDGKVAASKLGL